MSDKTKKERLRRSLVSLQTTLSQELSAAPSLDQIPKLWRAIDSLMFLYTNGEEAMQVIRQEYRRQRRKHDERQQLRETPVSGTVQ
jgi:hypothetical protein